MCCVLWAVGICVHLHFYVCVCVCVQVCVYVLIAGDRVGTSFGENWLVCLLEDMLLQRRSASVVAGVTVLILPLVYFNC